MVMVCVVCFRRFRRFLGGLEEGEKDFNLGGEGGDGYG